MWHVSPESSNQSFFQEASEAYLKLISEEITFVNLG